MSDNNNELRRKHLSELQMADTPLGSYCTNLPGEGRALLKSITKVRATSDFTVDDIPAAGFATTYYYAHPVEMEVGDTGEMGRQTRVILIDSDLATVSFVSQGVVSSMDLILTHLGQGPWTTPVMMALRKKKTGKGRQVYSLEVLD